MQIFKQQNLILFSIPKTGSTAYAMALSKKAGNKYNRNQTNKHMNVRWFENFVGPILRQLEVGQMERIAVLRSPLKRAESWYKYRRRLPASDEKSTSEISFEKFIFECLKSNTKEYAKIGNQRYFVTQKSGDIGIHHLFAIEQAEIFGEFLKTRFGSNIKVPFRNISAAADVSLSSELKTLFEEKRSGEISIYNSILEADGHLITSVDVK